MKHRNFPWLTIGQTADCCGVDRDMDPNTVAGKLAELCSEMRLTPSGTVSAGLRYIARQRDIRADDELPAGLLTVATATEYLRAASPIVRR